MPRILALLLCISLVLSGCAAPPAPATPPAAQPTPASTATTAPPAPSDAQPALEPAIEPDTRSDQEIQADLTALHQSLDQLYPPVTFEPQKDRAATLEWTGEPAQVSVTDSAGLTWTLAIPAGALPQAQTITLTPLANVDDGRGRPKSGVLFAPAGLIFKTPAELTVTGPGAEKTLLLFADQQGKDMLPAPAVPIPGGVRTPVFHFSTSFADPTLSIPAEAAQAADEAYRLYAEHIDKIKDLLKKEIKPPKPIKVDLACDGHFDPDEIDAFLKKYVDEEIGYTGILYATYMAATIKGDAGRQQEAMALFKQTAARGRAKLDLFLNFDALKPETYFLAYFSMNRAMFLIGFEFLASGLSGSPDPALANSLWEYFLNVQRAGDFTWDYLLNGIRSEHKYSWIMAALITESMLQVTSGLAQKTGQAPEERDYRAELSSALTFTISFSGTTVQEGDDSVATWTTEGQGQVVFQQFIASGGLPEEWVLQDSGQGKHTGFTTTDPSAAKDLLTTAFTPEMVLTAFVPCFTEVHAGTTRFGAGELVYASDIGPLTVPSFYNLINQLALEDDYNALHKAVLAEMDDLEDGVSSQTETVDGDHEQTTIVYTITLEHTPQSAPGSASP